MGGNLRRMLATLLFIDRIFGGLVSPELSIDTTRIRFTLSFSAHLSIPHDYTAPGVSPFLLPTSPLHSSHSPLHDIQDDGGVRVLCPFETCSTFMYRRLQTIFSRFRVYPDPRPRIHES
ncbi:hypothetical protein ARMSODRAFT_967839 [Armillaria solidipes]|uniref:Secreted protein n=1 Tax=Armillaria solidipes TaxID=1076256 RepID=A0A2H3AX26_9AGAR|nr:hypothetical protein ARMSODRAFT_967839 [Armillaria solidipes]